MIEVLDEYIYREDNSFEYIISRIDEIVRLESLSIRQLFDSILYAGIS